MEKRRIRDKLPGFATLRRTIPWEALWSTGCRRRAASCGRAASYPRFPASHPQNPCRLNQQKIMLFNIDIHHQVDTFFSDLGSHLYFWEHTNKLWVTKIQILKIFFQLTWIFFYRYCTLGYGTYSKRLIIFNFVKFMPTKKKAGF